MLSAINRVKVNGKYIAPGDPLPKNMSAEDKKYLLDQGAIGDDDSAGKKSAADKAAAEKAAADAEAARIAAEAAQKARLVALPPA
jgi:hypothetical protein